ncbi:SDR family NAD(P)-dependent oxidoreductase [Cognatishimia sp. D5M38]|uniref:SDR family NAD(P)-dependent oxidoreductase n=1 Tax=Cognatishimia coralii TaxID=3083254 RepID=A0ABU8QIW6_9RHOB
MSFASILITGASSGLGAALSKELAGPDVTLVLVGRNLERLTAVAEACAAQGATALPLQLDLTDQDAALIQLTKADQTHKFDLAIANAGVAYGRETPELARSTTATNVLGVLSTIQAVEPGMVARGKGQIGLISSLAAFRTLGGPAAYAASKAWVRLFGEAMRGRLARKGVGVTVICPGFVDTPMVDDRTRAQFGASMMPADKAAQKIVKALAKNHARLSFPSGFSLRTWWLSTLPAWWTDRKIRRAARKAARQKGL